MFREISQQLYGYILNAERILLDIYKVNPWQIVGEMPLVDLQLYMKKIEDSWKKKKDNFKKKDMMEVLKHINDVLPWIFHKK